MANYSTASRVLSVINYSDEVERVRSENRSKVQQAANCVPPLSPELCKELGIKINVNWGELLVLMTHANTQMYSAFGSSQNFFTVKMPFAPKDQRDDWGAAVTNGINKVMRESIEFFILQMNKFKCLTQHGVAVTTWPDKECWLPKFKALSDVRIPTDTTIDFQNLDAFALRTDYTVFDLIKEAFVNDPDNHWNKKSVATILRNYKELNITQPSDNYDVGADYEKFVEAIKQDGGYYNSDALPTISLYNFFFRDFISGTRKQAWFRRVVPATGVIKSNEAVDEDFLWTSDEPWCDSWTELIHGQFGDLSSDTPVKFHSVRGLGFILLEPTYYSNLTRCRMVQHLNDQFNILLRITDPAEKSRAAIQEFSNLGVIRSGVQIVPENERHQVDGNLIQQVLAQTKQLMSEASASYTQQSDNGTAKEQTAFETRVKLEQVNALMGGILTMAFKFEAGSYREIARRFCIRDSEDPDVMKFQQQMRLMGIPPEHLIASNWEVEPVTPLGWGNPTIAQAAAQQMMSVRGMLSPEAQTKVLHEYVLTTTKDPRKAADLVPISGKTTQSDATREAIGLFATLLISAPGSVPPPQDHYIDQINVLLPLLAGKITLYTKRNNMANQEEVMGLTNVATYISQAVQALSQDPQAKEAVKHAGDALGKLNNEIKALAQRGQAAATAAQKQQADGEANAQRAKMQMEIQSAQMKSNNEKARTAQKMHLDDMKFKRDERRKDAQAHAEMIRQNLRTAADISNQAEKSKLKSIPTEE